MILLNSTCLRDDNEIRIFNYNIHKRNYLNELHAGVAIAIKKTIEYKILDDYRDDLLGIQIQTSKGPVALFTIYSPPRRNYLPLGDIRRALQRNIPVYIIADLNAHHQILGYTRVNNKGRMVKDLIDRNIARYLGPDFPTLIDKNTKPDAVITNRISYLNISIQPGDITTSDHLPIVITISTRPIANEKQPKFNFKKANWQKFQEKISNNTILTNMNNLTKDDIDKETKNWMNTIISSANETIPKSKIHYLTHPVDSDYFKDFGEYVYATLQTR